MTEIALMAFGGLVSVMIWLSGFHYGRVSAFRSMREQMGSPP